MNDRVKKENRRALPKFFLVILAAGLVGGVLGFLAGMAGHAGLAETAERWIDAFWRAITPWGIPVSSVLLLGGALFQYRAARRAFAGWNGEDEAVVDRAEERLSWALLLTALTLILDFLFLAAANLYLHGVVRVLMSMGTFLLSSAGIVVLQQKVVDLEKTMNPEKRGSVYDMKFQKKWYESCDEAEQRQIGQAAYRAFSLGSQFCTWLWLALVILGFVFNIGMLPIVTVLLIWGVLQVTYTLECIRLGRR